MVAGGWWLVFVQSEEQARPIGPLLTARWLSEFCSLTSAF
jgi:hypothetical protein